MVSLDPQNNRPSSQQNLRAIEKLNKGIHWTSATNTSINSSTVLVRNLPIAFWLCSPEAQKHKRWQITQEATVLTHASSECMTASCLLNEALSLLLAGYQPNELPKMLRNSAISMAAYWSENLETHSGDFLAFYLLKSIWKKVSINALEKSTTLTLS